MFGMSKEEVAKIVREELQSGGYGNQYDKKAMLELIAALEARIRKLENPKAAEYIAGCVVMRQHVKTSSFFPSFLYTQLCVKKLNQETWEYEHFKDCSTLEEAEKLAKCLNSCDKLSEKKPTKRKAKS